MTDLWNQYKRRYFDYEASISQLQLVVLATTTVLDNFPSNLPREMKEELANTLETAGSAMLRTAEAAKQNSGESREAAKFSAGPFSTTALRLLVSQYASVGHLQGLDFRPLVAGIQTVMTLAHLDGFLSDSLRAVCRREPRVLSRDKKVEWRTIMQLGSWDALVEQLEEQFCYEFGWKSLRERLVFLDKQIGLEMNVPTGDFKELHYAEQVRHVIIHNGGRASAEFLGRSGDEAESLRVGDVVPLDSVFATIVTEQGQQFGKAVYEAVAGKFFDVDKSELFRVPDSGNDTGA